PGARCDPRIADHQIGQSAVLLERLGPASEGHDLPGPIENTTERVASERARGGAAFGPRGPLFLAGALQPTFGDPTITLPGGDGEASVIEAHGDDLAAGVDQEVGALLKRHEQEAKRHTD